LKATGAFHETKGFLLTSAPTAIGWITAFGVAGGIAVAYYLAARLGLALLSAPSDVAVFWPASGIAVGILIIANRRVSPAIVVGVIVGTLAANLMSDRSFLTSLFKGLCNAGEAVLVAGLIDRWFGRPFAFVNLRCVLGFVAATCLGAAAAALGGAATMTLLHTTAPFWDVWRAWLLSDGVGIVMVAPLVIGLGQVPRKPPSRAESIEAAGVLSLVALISWYAVAHPTGSWLSFDTDAVVLPLLLWLVARCKPVFGIAGAFIVSLTVIYATTFGIGHFGDVAVPAVERVSGAHVVITMVTLYTLVLAALFVQRKDAEEELRQSEKRSSRKSAALAGLHEAGLRLWHTHNLHEALDEILAGAIELLGADKGNIQVLDSSRGKLNIAVNRGFKQEFLDCFNIVSAADGSACGRALRSGERIVIEDVEVDTLYEPFRPAARLAGYRAVQSTPIMGREGKPLGILSTHFRSVHRPNREDLLLLDLYVRQASDIIERHETYEALRKSEERLRLAQLKTGIGLWDWDLRTGTVTWTPELEAIFGLEPGTVKCYADFRDRIHPDDIERVETERDAAVRRRDPFTVECRIIRSDGEVRWILGTGGAVYDEVTGEPIRVLGNSLDITSNKLAEARLSEHNAQLDLAGKIARIGSFTYDHATQKLQLSPGCAAIYGLPEGTVEISRENWRALVHPDDLQRLDAVDRRVLANSGTELVLEFRILRHGEVRWIESRVLISYDEAGRPIRRIGAQIDVTERKQAEQALAERNAQFDLAHKAARVGCYTHDISAGTMRFSRASAATHGLSQSAMELTAQQWYARIHRDDMQRLRALHIRAFKERRPELVSEFRFVRPGGEVRWIESRSLITYDHAGRAERMTGVYIDVTDRRNTEDHKNLLIAELDHRVKNVLACVAAIAQRSRECTRSADELLDVLNRRINSLANTHALLSRSHWEGVHLGELIHSELAFCANHKNLLIEGPGVVLAAEATQPVAMVLHELATNAAKYGALSNGHGRVLVRWRRPASGPSDRNLVLEWQETGGPPVVAPNPTGYGTSVIRDLIPYELGGTADFVIARDGIRCKFEIPARWLSCKARPTTP